MFTTTAPSAHQRIILYFKGPRNLFQGGPRHLLTDYQSLITPSARLSKPTEPSTAHQHPSLKQTRNPEQHSLRANDSTPEIALTPVKRAHTDTSASSAESSGAEKGLARRESDLTHALQPRYLRYTLWRTDGSTSPCAADWTLTAPPNHSQESESMSTGLKQFSLRTLTARFLSPSAGGLVMGSGFQALTHTPGFILILTTLRYQAHITRRTRIS
jgi:hypothetical protein